MTLYDKKNGYDENVEIRLKIDHTITVNVDFAHGLLQICLSEEDIEQEVEDTIKEMEAVTEYLRSNSSVWQMLANNKKNL